MLKRRLLIALGVIVVIALGLALTVRLLLSPESVRSAIEQQTSAALGMPVKVGAASARVWPRPGVTLSDVAVGEPAQITLQRARISTGLGPLLLRRVEDAEVIIENSRLDLPKLLATLQALGGTDASAAGTSGASSGITIVNVKTIALSDVEIVAGDRQAMVSLESVLEGDRLDISRLSARAEKSTVQATGAIESLAKRIVRLAIEAERLDVDGLLQFASAFSSPSPSQGGAPSGRASSPSASAADQAAAPLDLQATVRATEGSLFDVAFANLQGTVKVTPAQVTLAPLTFGAFNGRVTGEIALGLAGAQPELTVTSTFEGIDVAQVAAFAGQSNAVTGTLNGRMRVTGRGLDATSALRTANGTGDVTISNGRIPGLQLVRPAVLAFGRPQDTAPPEGSGESFDKLSATLAISGGQVRTDNLMFESRDVDMTGAGTLGIASGAGGPVNLKANVMLSEELSAQAGRDLVRYAHEGNRVVLPTRITGTVSSPVVMIDESQALQRALRNEVEERTKSLFKDLLSGRPKKP